MTRIKAVQQGTNAQLVATAAKLYPLDGAVLDMTPGVRRGFWQVIEPAGLVELPSGTDFRATGYADGSFDAVVFDPPYVARGGRGSSGNVRAGFLDAYGMDHTERTPRLQWDLQMMPGVVEARRILRRGGLLWFKLQDYVSGDDVHWFTKIALNDLRDRGFWLVDEFILDGNPRQQPAVNPDGSPRRQVHAAKAHSVLMIARAK